MSLQLVFFSVTYLLFIILFYVIVVAVEVGPPTFVKIKSAIADATIGHDYVITWYQPDDGGMPIRRYRVQYRQVY